MFAITGILNGCTVKDAAISCGFSDSSHFHKMLLQMFGITPSQFIKENNKKSIQICHHYPLSLETKRYNEESWNVEEIYKLLIHLLSLN